MFSSLVKCRVSWKETVFFEILITVLYEIILWTQNRMNCRLFMILRRDLRFFVVAHRFLQREKGIPFPESWEQNSDRKQVLMGNFTKGWVRWYAGRIDLLLLRTIFKEWIFRVASCCFYMILIDTYLLYMDNLSSFVRSWNDFHIWAVFLFLGTWCNF